MKRILLLPICLLFVRSANAQKSLLALNEQNKYIYYQVIDLPGISADSLYKNSVYFVKEVYPKTKSQQMSNAGIIVKDKFLTYSALAFSKHENGEIGYTLNIECKESKYRFWLTDFVFTPYERNRYGVFVPAPGINIPLEAAKAKIDKKELDGYLEQTGTFCQQLGEKLKKYMTEGHEMKKADQPPAKIVTDKW